MRDATPAARQIDILVNSHADGDHTDGNQMVGANRIIVASATASEFMNLPPAKLQSIIDKADLLGEGAQYIAAWTRNHGFVFEGEGALDG